MRLLHDARDETNVFQRPVLAFGADPLFRPQAPDYADRLLEALARLGHRHAVDLKLLWQESAPESRVESALAHVVEHRQVAAEMRRMMERRDHRAGDEPDALRARGNRGQEDARVGRMAAVIVEGMLDCLDARVAELIGSGRKPQALVVVIG